MIKHYDLTENDVSAKPYEAEALYYCTDSKNIYFDSPTEGKRIEMSSDTIILATENERRLMLAPIADIIYIVLSSACMYIYSGGMWISLNQTEFEVPNVQVIGGRTTTIHDSRILYEYNAIFIPDPSIADLVTKCEVTCYDGSAFVAVYPYGYNFFGRLLVGNKDATFYIQSDCFDGVLELTAKRGMTFAKWLTESDPEGDMVGVYSVTKYTTNGIPVTVSFNTNMDDNKIAVTCTKSDESTFIANVDAYSIIVDGLTYRTEHTHD